MSYTLDMSRPRTAARAADPGLPRELIVASLQRPVGAEGPGSRSGSKYAYFGEITAAAWPGTRVWWGSVFHLYDRTMPQSPKLRGHAETSPPGASPDGAGATASASIRGLQRFGEWTSCSTPMARKAPARAAGRGPCTPVTSRPLLGRGRGCGWGLEIPPEALPTQKPCHLRAPVTAP